MRRTPALIVGGGPAGAAAAIVLARAGAPHLLIERTRETGDALCGGFLSWRTLETLAKLGVEAGDLNPARIVRARLFAGTRRAEALLPRPAVAVSRRRLDTLLLTQAIASGAAVERGIGVREIGDHVRTDDAAAIDPDALFLASGKHDVRGMPRPATARGHDPALGLRVRLGPSAALTRMVDDAIELHLFDGGYAGLALQEDGTANLCLAVRRSRLHAAGDASRLLQAIGDACPALGERLAWLDPAASIDAVANVPYGWRATTGAPRRFRLGDQAGVIPSLAGEGMGIAIASGRSAAHAYLRDGADAARGWQREFAAAIRRPIGIADAIRAIAERPASARTLVAAARLPGLLRVAARATRIGRHPTSC